MIKATIKDLFDQEKHQERYFNVMFGQNEIFYFKEFENEEVRVTKLEGYGSDKGGGIQINIARPSDELLIKSMQETVDRFKKSLEMNKK